MATDLFNKRVVKVPDVVGRPLNKAQILLEDAGFSKVVALYRESYEERDTVLEQRPARGQMVYESTEVTIWIARRGYLENLPAIYRRSDAVGRNLVRDLCFLFEHMFDSVEVNLTDNWRFYDPHVAPPEFLDWLARWTAFTLDLDWPEPEKRALIKRAVDLYRIRGTKRGLSLFLKLFTGHEPAIKENTWPFRGFRVEPNDAEEGTRVALDTVILPPVDLASCFVVTMPIKFDTVTPEMVIRIHQIIALEKPAHCNYYLEFAEEQGDVELREFFSIGLRSGIGIGAEVVQAIEGEEDGNGSNGAPGGAPRDPKSE
ncbi:MAG: PASTA domain-containing protein [Deltaproteobacteria bacterium]|nr:PASTA domain-containing protein [Deltaproteobacteria bacterium]MCW5806399.1 PASTA domain-containing protein [Deltaproteobacteria bacterium]